MSSKPLSWRSYVSPSLLVPLLPCLCYIYQHYSQHIVTRWSRWWMVKHAMMPALHAPPLWHSLASPHPNTPLSACLHVYSDYLFIYSGSGKNKLNTLVSHCCCYLARLINLLGMLADVYIFFNLVGTCVGFLFWTLFLFCMPQLLPFSHACAPPNDCKCEVKPVALIDYHLNTFITIGWGLKLYLICIDYLPCQDESKWLQIDQFFC